MRVRHTSPHHVTAAAVTLCLSITVMLPCDSAAAPAGSIQDGHHNTASKILEVMERVADWQIARIDRSYVATRPNDSKSLRGWVYGTFYVGLSALADRSPDAKYAEAIYSIGRAQDWALDPRPFHADDYIVGQTWIWAYERLRDPKIIAATQARLDAIAEARPKVSLSFGDDQPPGADHNCQLRWCWSDALFMGPPTWAALSRATGDPKYLSYADNEYWTSVSYLFDEKDELFFRDSRYFFQRGAHGEKIFWSRGNGWVYAGLARILQSLPANYPGRPRYEALFRRMSARLVALQKPDGYWPVSLLAPPEGTPPETSGTGFFTFGLAYGVASGLLREPKYRVAAERGWAALTTAVDSNGKLGWVQQIGAGPNAVAASDTEPYGVGAFLLAGSAMLDLADGAHRQFGKTQ